MKRISPDKYTVAWFKLSEVISRGEKERALGMYRLLAHSLDNSAFAKQLEGDILLFFNDNAAYEKYREAVALYIHQERYAEAIMTYEHLLSIGVQPTQKQQTDLVSWYCKLKQYDKARQRAEQMLNDGIKNKNWSDVTDIIMLVKTVLPFDTWLCAMQQHIIERAIELQADSTIVLPYITSFLTELVAANSAHAMHQLLTYLRTTNTDYYQKACELIGSEDKQFVSSNE